MDKEIDRDVGAYLRRCRWALSALPEPDRDEIVDETRSHILDRIDAGATTSEALMKIGRAEEYAAQFVKDHAATSALSSGRAGALVAALIANATGNFLAVATLVSLFLVWALALLVAVVAVMKIFNPATVGLWSGTQVFFLGVIDDPSSARELLGVGIFPVAFMLLGFAWLITRRAAMWALNRPADAV